MQNRSIEILFAVSLVVFGTACGELFDGQSRSGNLSPYDDVILDDDPRHQCLDEQESLLTGAGHAVDLRDCTKLEGGQLGEDGLVVEVDGRTVEITDWRNKEGEGEYVGFTIDGDDVTYVVKAGQQLFESSDGTWVHPGGTSGSDAKGISFVAFCEPPGGGNDGGGGDDDGGGGDDDGGGDDPSCTPDRDPYGGGGTTDGGGDGTDGSGGDSTDGSGGDSTDGSGGDSTDGSGGDSTDGSGGDSTDGSGGDSTSGGDSGGDSCSTSSCSVDADCADDLDYCIEGCCTTIYL